MSTEKQAHYLGVVVGHRKRLEQRAAQDEQSKELKAKQLAIAFAATDIENIWIAAKDIITWHYSAKKRLLGVGVQLGKCGALKKQRGMTCGLKITDKLYGGPEWSCRRDSEGRVHYYAQQPSPIWDADRFPFTGRQTTKGEFYTADDMRESFIQFLLVALPPNALDGIEAVSFDAHEKAKTKRKVLVAEDN